MSDLTAGRAVRKSANAGTRAALPRYTLADVLAIIPKTKRSQVELLVRTGRITAAWPSPGTGHDRAFDGKNLFEIALAAELMELGLVGQRLTQFFQSIMFSVLDSRNASDAEYLVLLPHADGPLPLPSLLPRGGLEDAVGIFPSAYVVNVRRILGGLTDAINQFEKQRHL